MNNPYNLHSWNQQYRQEALREARVRHLIRPAKRRMERTPPEREPPASGRACFRCSG